MSMQYQAVEKYRPDWDGPFGRKLPMVIAYFKYKTDADWFTKRFAGDGVTFAEVKPCETDMFD